jgi:hypothetical protein
VTDQNVGVRRCRCGHPKSDHRGTLTRESTGRLISETACLAGTRVARIGNWHAERVGGDRCQEWQFSLRETLRALRIRPARTGGNSDE